MSFFRYAGGKSKLRDLITKCLSEQADHSNLQYREPFFGGGSIGLKLLAVNSNIKNIWINDKDIGIACLWTSVIKYPEEFKEQVLNFTPSVCAFHDFKRELTSLTSMPQHKSQIVEIGFKKLAIHQISYSGLGTKSGGPLGGEQQKSNYKIDCRWSPEYICKKITALNIAFSEVKVHDNSCTNLDFSDLIVSDDCKGLIYLDPPYYEKGNVLYQCGFQESDHERLALLLKECKHPWVLSYDDCKQVRKLYEWAAFHAIGVKYSITATKDEETGERASRTKPELLIYSKNKDINVKPIINSGG